MRIAEVIGTVTLSRCHPSLDGLPLAHRRAVQPEGAARTTRPDGEDLVIFDDLGAGLGSRSASAKASRRRCRFYPNKKPVDAYCACILDTIERQIIALDEKVNNHERQRIQAQRSKSARSAGAFTPRASRPPTTATSPSRLNDKEILCTPTMVSKGFMKPEDICKVDYDGKQLAGTRKRTSEVLLHLAVYKNRPDVNAVVHCHPPHATAFAVAHEPIPKCVLPEVEVFLGEVPIASTRRPATSSSPTRSCRTSRTATRSCWPTTAR